MTVPAIFKQSDVKRAVAGAIAGAMAAGFQIARIEFAPDGKISFIRESSADNDDGGDPGEWKDA